MRIELINALPEGFDRLEAEAVAEGHAFLTKLKRRWTEGSNRFDRRGELLLAAYSSQNELIGIAGLNVDPYVDDPTLGRVRHLYVSPSSRRWGVGKALLERITEHARGHFKTLRLRTQNPDAVIFYGAHGFTLDPSATEGELIGLQLKF